MRALTGKGARATALLLLISMCAQGGTNPAGKLLTAPLESVVRVQLKSGGELRGRLESITDRSYVLKVAVGDVVAPRELTFAETKSVAVESRHSRSLKRSSAKAAVTTLTVLGVIFGTGALVSLINR